MTAKEKNEIKNLIERNEEFSIDEELVHCIRAAINFAGIKIKVSKQAFDHYILFNKIYELVREEGSIPEYCNDEEDEKSRYISYLNIEDFSIHVEWLIDNTFIKNHNKSKHDYRIIDFSRKDFKSLECFNVDNIDYFTIEKVY